MMVPTADEVFTAADLIAKVTVEQGGCIETSRPTTHSDRTFVEEGVTQYCVANILGGVAQTSTLALTSDDDVVRNWRVVRRGPSNCGYASDSLRCRLTICAGAGVPVGDVVRGLWHRQRMRRRAGTAPWAGHHRGWRRSPRSADATG